MQEFYLPATPLIARMARIKLLSVLEADFVMEGGNFLY